MKKLGDTHLFRCRMPFQQEVATESSIDPEEMARFSSFSECWWDKKGPFRLLHTLTPLRISYLKRHICSHFQRDLKSTCAFEGLRILDVGCGGGILCEPMARLGGRVHGIDPEPAALRAAEDHAALFALPISYTSESAESLAETGQKFDVVCALEVVEHVADRSVFLTALAKLLAPRGLLFLSTLNQNWKSFLFAIVGAEYFLRWLPIGTHSYAKFMRPAVLYSELSSRGLTPLGQIGIRYDPLSGSWSLCQEMDVNYMMVFSAL